MKVSLLIYAYYVIMIKAIIEYMILIKQYMIMAKVLFNVLMKVQKKIFIWINLKVKVIKQNGYINLVMKHVKLAIQEEMHMIISVRLVL